MISSGLFGPEQKYIIIIIIIIIVLNKIIINVINIIMIIISPQTKSAMRSMSQLLGRNSPVPMWLATQSKRLENGAIS